MVLETLFNGELFPCEQIHTIADPEQAEATRKTGKIMAILQEHLSKEDFALVEELSELYQNEGILLDERAFKYGLSLGMKFSQEIQDELDKYVDCGE